MTEKIKNTYRIFRNTDFKDKDMSRAFNSAINPIVVSLLLEEIEELELKIKTLESK